MIFLQLFAGGTDLEVALWIEGEVAAGEGSVRALGFVHQFHMPPRFRARSRATPAPASFLQQASSRIAHPPAVPDQCKQRNNNGPSSLRFCRRSSFVSPASGSPASVPPSPCGASRYIFTSVERTLDDGQAHTTARLRASAQLATRSRTRGRTGLRKGGRGLYWRRSLATRSAGWA
jgi:hypothetical protein